MTTIVVRPGHVQPVWAGHPWIFAQGLETAQAKPTHGEEVEVLDARGKGLGRGFFSDGSAIAVRLFSTDPLDRFDAALVERKLAAAAQRRMLLGLNLGINRPEETAVTTGYRAFHGEGDGIPGLVVDKFEETLVIQLGSAGLAQRREEILDALEAHFKPRAILDRTTEKAARADRFEARNGLARGVQPEALRFRERGLYFELPLSLAQKTGFYFDQRPLRERVETLAPGKTVLDCYSYVGPVGLAAARGGASRVVCVDSSAPALEVGRKIAETNDLRVEFEKADSLAYLNGTGFFWDIVVSDPPKLAQTRGGRDKALHAFRRIAASSVRAVAPGGLLILSSCSAAIGLREVERCLALGARDVGRTATTLERIFQGSDHPVPPAFPEGLYLTTVVAEVR